MYSISTMKTLAYRIRLKLGASKYRMAKLLQRTESGYDRLERVGQKYRVRDIIVLKMVSGLDWEEFGKLLGECLEDDG